MIDSTVDPRFAAFERAEVRKAAAAALARRDAAPEHRVYRGELAALARPPAVAAETALVATEGVPDAPTEPSVAASADWLWLLLGVVMAAFGVWLGACRRRRAT